MEWACKLAGTAFQLFVGFGAVAGVRELPIPASGGPAGRGAARGDRRTIPETGLPGWGVVGVEAALTTELILTTFVMLSSSSTARWTPGVVTAALAGLIWAEAPLTGASMNPARTFAPDTVTGAFGLLWAYVVGPLAGACVAVGVFRLLGMVGALGREWETLTASCSTTPTIRPCTPAPWQPGRIVDGPRRRRGAEPLAAGFTRPAPRAGCRVQVAQVELLTLRYRRGIGGHRNGAHPARFVQRRRPTDRGGRDCRGHGD